MSKTDEYQRTAEQYRQDTKEHGTESATERWCKPLFDAWMYSLDSETDRTSDETKRRLTALMRGNLNVRDAMIASIIDSTISTADMIGFAAYPKDKENKARMSALLAMSLGNAADGKTPWLNGRFDTALDMLYDMATAPERFGAQPLAIIAYASWLAGASNAASIALQALTCDEDCTLAAIVLSGIQAKRIPVRC